LLRGLDSGLDGTADGSRGALELILILDDEFCSPKLSFPGTIIKTMGICDGNVMSSTTGLGWLPLMSLASECIRVDSLGLTTTLETYSKHKLTLNVFGTIV
jgi:hypothetical protein